MTVFLILPVCSTILYQATVIGSSIHCMLLFFAFFFAPFLNSTNIFRYRYSPLHFTRVPLFLIKLPIIPNLYDIFFISARFLFTLGFVYHTTKASVKSYFSYNWFTLLPQAFSAEYFLYFSCYDPCYFYVNPCSFVLY